MARLSPKKRARLPDGAFAYIDSRGRRRLPVHDKAHVKNALARFSRVIFESDTAREEARRRLLNAAKKFRLMPVGFITGQLASEQQQAATRRLVRKLPRGFVTLLMTDIEGSTGLLRRLGDRYAALLKDVRTIIRRAVSRGSGREIDARADEFFAVFERPAAAVETSVAMQRALAERAWPGGVEVRVRAGLHSGHPTLTDAGYIGLAVHVTARVCAAAHGGQILLSGAARAAASASTPSGVRFRSLGRHRLAGLLEPEPLFQVQAAGLRPRFPPPRAGRTAARRDRLLARGTDGAKAPRAQSRQLELPELE